MEENQIYRILEEAYFGENSDESAEIENLNLILPSNSKLFVDVGASLGQYTKRANEIMKNGHIIAIEADPIRFKRLKQLSERWAKDSTNIIEVIHAAATNMSGLIDFFITNSNVSGALSERNISEVNNWEKIRVSGLTLDEICRNKKPDLVKIDVEDGELNVILGSKSLLLLGVKFLVEIHQYLLKIKIEKLFSNMGYISNKFHNHRFYEKKITNENRYNYL